MNGDRITRTTRLEPDTTANGGAGADILELEDRRYATQSGLARMLGVTPRTLARWDERRLGPPKIKVGKMVLYDLAKLHGWLEDHERTPPAAVRMSRGRGK